MLGTYFGCQRVTEQIFIIVKVTSGKPLLIVIEATSKERLFVVKVAGLKFIPIVTSLKVILIVAGLEFLIEVAGLEALIMEEAGP